MWTAWDLRMDEAAGQSEFVEMETMKEARTEPRELAVATLSGQGVEFGFDRVDF
jgi:hypothetical protein